MPPEIEPIPLPAGRGLSARDWLEAHGIMARVPPIRSGSYAAAAADPFHYYLVERLGLVPALHSSEVLSHGAWMHKCLELFAHDIVERARRFDLAVRARQKELSDYCESFGILGDTKRLILDTEENRARHAWTWFEAAADLCVRSQRQPDGGPLAYGFRAWLGREQHQILGHELMLVHRHPRYSKTVLCGRIDLLLLHKPQNTLWVVDLKSTSSSTVARGQTCPFESQTSHYLLLLEALLNEGVLQDRWPQWINSETKIGGMRHLLIRKPSIRLSGQDRPFTYDTSPLRSGPRKGQPRNEKIYHGDPSFDLYLERVRDWMKADGDYTHEKPLRQEDPVVNLSTSFFSALDQHRRAEYTDLLDTAYSYATCSPHPENFPRTGVGMTERYSDELSVFAPFYSAPIAGWPELIERQRIIQKPRDPEVEPHTPTGIYDPKETTA